MTQFRSIALLIIAMFSVFPRVATAQAQAPEIKFIADTLVIQADGVYQADPDLATVVFNISAQDKELKATYDQAAASMQHSSGVVGG